MVVIARNPELVEGDEAISNSYSCSSVIEDCVVILPAPLDTQYLIGVILQLNWGIQYLFTINAECQVGDPVADPEVLRGRIEGTRHLYSLTPLSFSIQ